MNDNKKLCTMATNALKFAKLLAVRLVILFT